VVQQPPHLIIDRKALSKHLTRAMAIPGAGEHPLVNRVTDDITDRLSAILRDFERAVVVSPLPGDLATRLAGHERVGAVCDARTMNTVTTAEPCHAPAVFGPVAIDDERLPFRAGSLDLLVSAFALQATNDLPGALLQIRRALKPDGVFIGVLLAGRTLEELRHVLLQAEAECTGGASPRVLPFAEVRELGGLMQRAGFALPVADSDTITLTYPSPLHLMQELRSLGATNIMLDRTKMPTRRQTLLRAVEIYAEKFSEPDGRIRATVELVTVTGWAPDASQPQPLKPGTATVRLSDALKSGRTGTDPAKNHKI